MLGSWFGQGCLKFVKRLKALKFCVKKIDIILIEIYLIIKKEQNSQNSLKLMIICIFFKKKFHKITIWHNKILEKSTKIFEIFFF